MYSLRGTASLGPGLVMDVFTIKTRQSLCVRARSLMYRVDRRHRLVLVRLVLVRLVLVPLVLVPLVLVRLVLVRLVLVRLLDQRATRRAM